MALAEPRGKLVQEIATRPGDFLMQPGYADFGFAPVLRKLLLPRQPALKAGQAGKRSLQSIQRLHQFALGRGRKHTHAPVDADCRCSPGHRVGNLELHLENDIPPVGFAGGGGLFNRTWDFTAFVEPDPADFGQVDAAVFDLYSLREAEAVVPALLFEPGQSLKRLVRVESVREGPGQVLEFLLENLGMGFGQEAVFFGPLPKPEQPAEVRVPQDGDAAVDPVEIQPQSFVPDEAGVAGHRSERFFGFGCRF